MNHKSLSTVVYLTFSDWSLLLLVNTVMVVFTVNKIAYSKHFTTSCGIWKRIYNFLSVYGK